MNKPYITTRPNGEYSTVVLPDGGIETCWFGNDGSSKVIGRYLPPSLSTVAYGHIAAYESGPRPHQESHT